MLLTASHRLENSAWSNPVWESIRERPTLFDGAFAYYGERFSLAQGGEIDPVDGLWASGRKFDVLGVEIPSPAACSRKRTTDAAAGSTAPSP